MIRFNKARVMVAVSLVGTLALAACTKTEGNTLESAFDVGKKDQEAKSKEKVLDLQAYCPKLVLRAGTETYRTYAKGFNKNSEGASAAVAYQATMTDVVRECKRENGMLTIRVGAAGRIIAGPKGGSGTFNMPIRVAATKGGDVIYSKLHQVPGSIPQGRRNNVFNFVENSLVIPEPDQKNIIVYVGFDEGPPKKSKGS